MLRELQVCVSCNSDEQHRESDVINAIHLMLAIKIWFLCDVQHDGV